MVDEHVPSDEELLTAWRAGDAHSGEVLIKRHHARICRFFEHKGVADAEDLVAQTFLGLVEGLSRFRGEASFTTLLFRIARNKLYDHFRRRDVARRRFDPRETSVAALDTSPSQAIANRQEQRLLLAALRELPLDTQLMLELHYWEQLKIKDIAIVLDMPEGTVKTRMRRGRTRLEELMEALALSKEELEQTMTRLSDWAAKLRDELGPMRRRDEDD